MKEIDISSGLFGSHYSLTDLYPQSEAKLREALASGEDFDTDWVGCKKEIRYARYIREGDSITVQVSAQMDDLWESDDLVYDALWEACQTEEELPDDFIDSIRSGAAGDIDDCSEISVVLPATATYEEIMAATEKAEEMAEQRNSEMFKRLCEYVKTYWTQQNEGKQSESQSPELGGLA